MTVTTSGAEDNQTVTVTLNGKSYTGTVASNSATVTVPAADLEALTDGSSYTMTADVADAAGNAATQVTSSAFTVDTTAPVISGITPNWGSVLNSTEDDSNGTVTVTTSGAEDNQTVTVTLNGNSYTGTVASNSATVTVPAADLEALTDGSSYTMTADVADAAGNVATQLTSSAFTVDTTAPSAVISSVTDDVGRIVGTLTSGDTTDDTSVVISGTNEAGSTVSIYDGSVLLGAATVDGTSWSYSAVVMDGNTLTLMRLKRMLPVTLALLLQTST